MSGCSTGWCCALSQRTALLYSNTQAQVNNVHHSQLSVLTLNRLFWECSNPTGLALSADNPLTLPKQQTDTSQHTKVLLPSEGPRHFATQVLSIIISHQGPLPKQDTCHHRRIPLIVIRSQYHKHSDITHNKGCLAALSSLVGLAHLLQHSPAPNSPWRGRQNTPLKHQNKSLPHPTNAPPPQKKGVPSFECPKLSFPHGHPTTNTSQWPRVKCQDHCY